MLGMIEGNGHPYSWSAIVNGYDPVEMAECPYAGIPQYLGAQPLESVRIPGARVTHIWTDDPADAPKVARASNIEHVVARPEDVIGQVDAVIIATDDGDEHVRRARPFIEAGLPVFIDKPMATNIADLNQFLRWHRDGRTILSTSGMRYAPEMRQIAERRERPRRAALDHEFHVQDLGALRHPRARGGVSRARPGFPERAALCSTADPTIAHLAHRSGVQVTLAAIHDAYGSFGAVHAYGTKGELALKLPDTYAAFRAQLLAFIELLRTGEPPASVQPDGGTDGHPHRRHPQPRRRRTGSAAAGDSRRARRRLSGPQWGPGARPLITSGRQK